MQNLLVITVATHYNDELYRFIESANAYGYGDNLTILGMGREWVGGDALNGRLLYPGGGMKVNLLKEFINGNVSDNDIILFTDSYDVVFNQRPEELLKKWDGVLTFSGEKVCWPNSEYEQYYPLVEGSSYRFLNSGGFIGKVSDIKKLILNDNIEDTYDDQLYYTDKYLDYLEGKNPIEIKIDHFQNMFQTLNESEIDVYVDNGVMKNNVMNTVPSIIHANGGVLTRQVLNFKYNFMNPSNEETIEYSSEEKILLQLYFDRQHTMPSVIIDGLEYLRHPKQNIDLLFVNNDKNNKWAIDKFIKVNGHKYNSVSSVYEPDMDTYQIRSKVLNNHTLTYDFDYLFMIDGDHQVKNAETIGILIEQNKDIITPMINKEKSYDTNFWGAVDGNGYFLETQEYFEIRNYRYTGNFNVPFTKGVFLIKKDKVSDIIDIYENFRDDELYRYDHYLVFSKGLRNKGLFSYVTNKRYFGKYFE